MKSERYRACVEHVNTCSWIDYDGSDSIEQLSKRCTISQHLPLVLNNATLALGDLEIKFEHRIRHDRPRGLGTNWIADAHAQDNIAVFQRSSWNLAQNLQRWIGRVFRKRPVPRRRRGGRMIVKETHRLAIRKEKAKEGRNGNVDVPVKNEFSFASPFEQLCYLAIGREKFRHDILRVA